MTTRRVRELGRGRKRGWGRRPGGWGARREAPSLLGSRSPVAPEGEEVGWLLSRCRLLRLQPACCQEPLFLVTAGSQTGERRRLEQRRGCRASECRGGIAGAATWMEYAGMEAAHPRGAAFGPQIEGRQLCPTPQVMIVLRCFGGKDLPILSLLKLHLQVRITWPTTWFL